MGVDVRGGREGEERKSGGGCEREGGRRGLKKNMRMKKGGERE